MKSPLTLVFYTMVIFGLLGGFVNFFSNWNAKDNWKYFLTQCLVLGVGASFLVPLFLQVISSNLLSLATSGWANYLVFCGLCLLASIYSKKFIQTIGDQILSKLNKVEKEAAKDQQRFETVVKQFADEPDITLSRIDQNAFVSNSKGQAIEILELLDARSQYKFRSIAGIAKDSKTDENTARHLLEILLKIEAVSSLDLASGKQLWAINPKGRLLLQELKKQK